jgi:hypothetical protein
VDTHVGRPERRPVIVAVLADPLGDVPRSEQGSVSGTAVELVRGSKRISQMERPEGQVRAAVSTPRIKPGSIRPTSSYRAA